jgi:hypothetical protein
MKIQLCTIAAILGCSLGAENIVANPELKITERYIPKTLCGRYGWQTGVDNYNGPEMMSQLGHDKVTALRMNEPFGNKDNLHPALKKRLEDAEKGKLPVLGKNYPYFNTKLKLPPKEQFDQIVKLPDFLGFRAFNEWGTGAMRMIDSIDGNMKVNTPVGRMIREQAKFVMKGKKTPKTRAEFEQLCRYLWDRYNKPFNYETHVFDGSHYWAKVWPGGWNKIRGVITENRTPYRSNSILQAITRGTARMWNVPYGYFPAYDWLARISPPMYSHMQKPRMGYQNQQGLLKISPSLYERLWVYNLMGNAAIIADESDHSRYIDLSNSGKYRFNWYGEICEKMRHFNDDYNLGISYNPVAIALSWHNGLVYYGDKAFYRFPYNRGEQMSRELIHRVAYSFNESREISDELGPTPYGDIFDILRLDTPKGAVDLELLKAYPVLFLAGNQRFTTQVKKVLLSYVKAGGTLILNTAMLKGSEFDKAFLGATINPKKLVGKETICTIDKLKLPSGKFTYLALTPNKGTKVLYTVNGKAVVTQSNYGKGRVILCSQEYLLEDREIIIDSVRRCKMLPTAYDLMKRISLEVLPISFKGEKLSQQLMYQVNCKKNSYVIALYNNGGLFYEKQSNQALAIEKADPNGSLKFTMIIPNNIKDAVSYTKHSKLYFTSTSKGKMLDFTIEPGKYEVIEISTDIIPDLVVTRPINLALKKKVKADSATARFGAEKAVDGNEDFLSAWWSSKACPQSMVVDLGKVETISSCKVIAAWSIANDIYPRFSQYKVWYSNDNKNWKLATDESKNVQFDVPTGLHRYFATPIKAQYFKLEVTFNSTRQGAQIVEFQLFNDKTQKVVLPWKKDPSKARFPSSILGMFTRKSLSSLTPKFATQSEANLTFDKECYTKKPLTIRKRVFARGLGTHAKSTIIYQLDPKDDWKLFTAYVGVDNVGGPKGSLEFKVYTDGKLAASSNRVNASNQAIPIWADISGCKELKLVVDDAGDGIYGDIANWCDAYLRK